MHYGQTADKIDLDLQIAFLRKAILEMYAENFIKCEKQKKFYILYPANLVLYERALQQAIKARRWSKYRRRFATSHLSLIRCLSRQCFDSAS